LDEPNRLPRGTDILVDVSRGDQHAIDYIDGLRDAWSLSAVTALELIVGAKNNREVAQIDQLLVAYGTIPLTENIVRRAYDLLKRYAKSHGLRTFDSLIAASAFEEGRTLSTMNRKHFAMIGELNLDVPAY
jgi:predicted nucleic acid-binding protein